MRLQLQQQNQQWQQDPHHQHGQPQHPIVGMHLAAAAAEDEALLHAEGNLQLHMQQEQQQQQQQQLIPQQQPHYAPAPPNSTTDTTNLQEVNQQKQQQPERQVVELPLPVSTAGAAAVVSSGPAALDSHQQQQHHDPDPPGGLMTNGVQGIDVLDRDVLRPAARNGGLVSSTVTGSGRDVPWEDSTAAPPAGSRSWFGVFGRKNNSARGQGRSTLI